MDVKPWEPVKGGWTGFDVWSWSRRKATGVIDDCGVVARSRDRSPLHITLANNQRVIVRALSEDRKAARAARKEASQ